MPNQCPANDEICAIIARIIALQNAAVNEELNEEMCDADTLGGAPFKERFNTRPIQVFTNETLPWTTPVDRDADASENVEKSAIFRAERIENGSVFLRALVRTDNATPILVEGKHFKPRFESTNSFITIRIDRLAAIRCLRDTFVNINIL